MHGGVRYLASGQVGVAWESARERHALITTVAPHLVQPVAFLVPLDGATGPAMGRVCEAGARAADLMRRAARTPTHLLPAPTRISAQDALVHAPCLDPDGLRGGLLSWDGRLEDDARLVVALARTAAALGADVVTGVAASDLGPDRLTLTDSASGASFVARGTVVNATGVWAGEHEPALRMVPSRGSHLVLRAGALGWPRAVLTVPVPGHLGRFVFAVPQPDGLVLLGLTDEPAGGDDPAAPQVPHGDETFLLDTLNRALATRLGPGDVVGRFAGLRPLVRGLPVHGRGTGTADISRRHLLLDEPDRPVTITGGKLTTYRRMAEDAVDAVCRRLGRTVRSGTRTLPLVGAAPRAVLARVAAPGRLVRRYGTEALVVHELAQREPAWAAPVAPGCAPPAPSCCSGPSPRARRRWRTCSSAARGSRWSTPIPPPHDRWPNAPWRSRRSGTAGRGRWPRRPDRPRLPRPARARWSGPSVPALTMVHVDRGGDPPHARPPDARARPRGARRSRGARCLRRRARPRRRRCDPGGPGDLGGRPRRHHPAASARGAAGTGARAGPAARPRRAAPPCRAPTGGSTRSTSCRATSPPSPWWPPAPAWWWRRT